MAMTPGERRFRLRVYSERSELNGRYWVYEVLDTSRPEGARIRLSGVRLSWWSALHVGLCYRRDFEAISRSGQAAYAPDPGGAA